MSVKYGKIWNGKIVQLYNEDQFNLEMSKIHFVFERTFTDNTFTGLLSRFKHEHVDEFIKWYTKRYYSFGKQTYTGTSWKEYQDKSGEWVSEPELRDKPLAECYVKLLKRDRKHSVYFVSYLNPETIYFNYNSLMAEMHYNSYSRYKHIHTTGPIPPYLDTRQGRHRSWTGYRSSNHFERWYAQQADARYYKSLGEPIPRLHAKGRTANKWDDWELEPRSGGAGWKEQTKDRHQWEHNLRNKQKGHMDVYKRGGSRSTKYYHNYYAIDLKDEEGYFASFIEPWSTEYTYADDLDEAKIYDSVQEAMKTVGVLASKGITTKLVKVHSLPEEEIESYYDFLDNLHEVGEAESN